MFPSPPSNQTVPASSLTISVLSPSNQSYTADTNSHVHIPLTIVSDVSLSWIGYSLDGESNITASNGTLIEIPVGSQTLSIYVNDTAGNWAVPQTIYYSVAWNGATLLQSFPWLPVTASISIVTIVVASLLIYFMKRKH